eukprot:3147343-Pleurochrysis_carterae.AAC.1
MDVTYAHYTILSTVLRINAVFPNTRDAAPSTGESVAALVRTRRPGTAAPRRPSQDSTTASAASLALSRLCTGVHTA